MRILADENFPGETIEALKQIGHDVIWMHTISPGKSDHFVLDLAQTEERILITFDKDFGELAFHTKIPAPCGIILFRIFLPSASEVTKITISALQSRDDWAGHFSVVEENRIRMTLLPSIR